MKVTLHWCKASNWEKLCYQQVNKILLCKCLCVLPCVCFKSSCSRVHTVCTTVHKLSELDWQLLLVLLLVLPFSRACAKLNFDQFLPHILHATTFNGKSEADTHTHTHGAHTHLQFVAYSPFDSALSAVTCTMCCTHMFSKSHSRADRLSNGIDSGHCVRCCCVWKWESGRCIFMSNGILRIQLRMQYLLNQCCSSCC